MGLLWTFMGYSGSYSAFTGAMEMAGGFLLFFRRTTTLGALIGIGVLSNIVMMNFCYDVPVKLFSSHLLLMAFFLAAPDLRRVTQLLVLNRPTQPVPLRKPFAHSWAERAYWPLKGLVIAGILWLAVGQPLTHQMERGSEAAKPPLYGVWEVESFKSNGKEIPPVLADRWRWRFMTVNRHKSAVVQNMDNSKRWFDFKDDPEKKTVTFSGFREMAFKYDRPDPGHLILQGIIDKNRLRIKLKLVPESGFLLLSRGFHWISEFPFNQ